MKNHTKIFLFITLYIPNGQNLSYTKINSINPLYLIMMELMGTLKKSMKINILR